MSVGFRRTILPARDQDLDHLDSQKVPVEIDLSWLEGRRGVQRQTVGTDCAAVKATVEESRALPSPAC